MFKTVNWLFTESNGTNSVSTQQGKYTESIKYLFCLFPMN